MDEPPRPLTEAFVRTLLDRSEDPAIEFKRQHNADMLSTKKQNSDAKEKNAELLRDILSLANGSITTAGRFAYLIVGAEDKPGSDGVRKLHSITRSVGAARDLLNMINENCNPRLPLLYIDQVTIDGHTLEVITIPPTAVLHETKKDLKTPQGKYSQHVVFVRHGDSIGIASAAERQTITDLKAVRFRARLTVPPVRFGSLVGAVVGGIIGDFYRIKHDTQTRDLTNLIVGVSSGASIGGLFGWTWRSIREWSQTRVEYIGVWRHVFDISTGLLVLIIARLLDSLRRRLLLSRTE